MFYFIFKSKNNTNNIFYSINDYPELKILEENYKLIASEIPKFNYNKINKNIIRSESAWNNKEGDKLSDLIKSEWISGWQKKDHWFNFPLMYHNKVIDNSDKICPKTINILKKIPSIQIAGYSILMPNSSLNKHVDATGKINNSMAVNMLLDGYNSNLYVNDIKYSHEKGKAVIFDSTIEHYANNKHTNKIRIILYIDFRIDTMYGIKTKGIGLASKLDYPTVNIKLLKKYDCGVYDGDSKYGKVTIFVKNNNIAECHYKEFNKDINKQKHIYIYNVKKLKNIPENSILDLYNKGCN
jgi:hypothetical protein